MAVSYEVKGICEPRDEVLGKLFSLNILNDWRRCKANGETFGQYMTNLLSIGKFSDTVLAVSNGDGSITSIKVHSSILGFHSEYFKTLFSGRWEEHNSIDLTSYGFCPPDIQSFIEFMYTGRTAINFENAFSLYQIAAAFLAQDIELHFEHLIFFELMNDENIFTVFVNTWNLKGECKFLEDLITYIRSTKGLINRPDMMFLSQIQLKRIFAEPMMYTTCTQMLRFCLKWAERTYGFEFLRNFSAMDQIFLEEFKLKDHFPRSLKDGFPVLSDLVQAQDTADFNDTGAQYTVHRFNDKSFSKAWSYCKNRFDKISVRFSQNVFLTDIGLYGDARFDCYTPDPCLKLSPAKYQVHLRIFHEGMSTREVFSGYKLECGSTLYRKIYYFAIVPKIVLLADVWYTIAVQISGAQSTWRGLKGVDSRLLECNRIPVLVEFKEPSNESDRILSSNGTGLATGQIPEVRFQIRSNGQDDDIVALPF